MTLDDIRKYTEGVADQDRSGQSCTEEQFNLYLQSENIDLFNEEWAKVWLASAEQNEKLLNVLSSHSPLYVFKKNGDIGITGSYFPLPTDYRYYLSISAIGGSEDRDIEVVEEKEFNRRCYTILRDDPDQKPFCRLEDNGFHLIPNDIDDINLVYIKTPETPYYDWCYNITTLVRYYMPVGSTINALGQLRDSEGNLLQAGVAHSSGALTYTSLSVELEWREDMHIKIANGILEKMGISQKDADLYTMAKNEDK